MLRGTIMPSSYSIQKNNYIEETMLGSPNYGWHPQHDHQWVVYLPSQ